MTKGSIEEPRMGQLAEMYIYVSRPFSHTPVPTQARQPKLPQGVPGRSNEITESSVRSVPRTAEGSLIVAVGTAAPGRLTRTTEA